ncbi:MAG: formyl transferase [Polynucleobacter sp. 39-45-136]|jgi:methionyl-tRNA formyltransferase|nr:MAG: formyl transferase [Polynucleobacter sp. 39-45-136]
MLKIGYFADGKWSHEAFKKLILDKDISIKFICVRFDSEDNTLLNYCNQYGIPYLKHFNINSPEFFSELNQFDCDLFVSMSFNQIFKDSIINLPPLKTINCHAGKLPFYRGRNVLNWVLINDESEFGITVHYVDSGIDTGDIIAQKIYPISDDDDYFKLLEKAYIGCADTLYLAIRQFVENRVQSFPQSKIHELGFYCTQRIAGDELINWNQTSRDIFNFVRAICSPGPQARAILNNKIIKINKCYFIPGAPSYKGIVGAVVGKNGRSLLVKTLDSTIEIADYEYDGVIKVGDRFDCK